MTRPMASNREAAWFLFWFLLACLICWALVIGGPWLIITVLLWLGSSTHTY